MAATELKIGQNSAIDTLKLKFEAKVFIDCMFLAYNWKDVFKFEILITDEPIENQNGRQQIQNGCHRA